MDKDGQKYNTNRFILVLLLGMNLLFSCSKNKVPEVTTTPLSKWELIAGHYKVYDTLGGYLYEMDLIHTHNDSTNRDSLRFEHFDGEFTFTTQQEEPINFPMYVAIGGGDTLYDSNHKRWKLWGGLYEDYNSFHNDTIRLRFQKTNINYWIEDVVPYYACDCRQIAVKQH